MQWQAFADIGSSFSTVAEYVPFFPFLVAAGAALGFLSCTIEAFALARAKTLSPAFAVVGFAIALCAVFVERFGFYCVHLTAGLSW